MFMALSTCVPCAYSTIGRPPEHCGAEPVGTMSAPETCVGSLLPPTVQYFR